MAERKEIGDYFLMEYFNRDDEKDCWVHLIRVQDGKTERLLSGDGALAK